MAAQTAAFTKSMYELIKTVIPLGGFWWQLMDGSGVRVNPSGSWATGANVSVSPAQCRVVLEKLCVGGANASATPTTWNRMQMYTVPEGGKGVTLQGFTDYTAEFLLTRGPYAVLGCASPAPPCPGHANGPMAPVYDTYIYCCLPPSPPLVLPLCLSLCLWRAIDRVPM